MWILSVSGFVRPAIQVSPELVRFSVWPLFHPQMQEHNALERCIEWLLGIYLKGRRFPFLKCAVCDKSFCTLEETFLKSRIL